MLTNRQLSNFKHYLNVTPKHLLGSALPRNPLGAYDSVGGAAAHGFARRLRLSDFARGGAFDAVGAGPDVTKCMAHLAEKLSPEDWAEFQNVLRGDDDSSQEDETSETALDDMDPRGGKIPVRGMDTRRRLDAMVANGKVWGGTFDEMFPAAAAVRTV